jgi:hypothetical protein
MSIDTEDELNVFDQAANPPRPAHHRGASFVPSIPQEET